MMMISIITILIEIKKKVALITKMATKVMAIMIKIHMDLEIMIGVKGIIPLWRLGRVRKQEELLTIARGASSWGRVGRGGRNDIICI